MDPTSQEVAEIATGAVGVVGAVGEASLNIVPAAWWEWMLWVMMVIPALVMGFGSLPKMLIKYFAAGFWKQMGGKTIMRGISMVIGAVIGAPILQAAEVSENTILAAALSGFSGVLAPEFFDGITKLVELWPRFIGRRAGFKTAEMAQITDPDVHVPSATEVAMKVIELQGDNDDSASGDDDSDDFPSTDSIPTINEDA